MGFARTLSALLSHLPKSRQTLLFSATQTQSVAQLARLSLKEPVSIGIGNEEILLRLSLNTTVPATLTKNSTSFGPSSRRTFSPRFSSSCRAESKSVSSMNPSAECSPVFLTSLAWEAEAICSANYVYSIYFITTRSSICH